MYFNQYDIMFALAKNSLYGTAVLYCSQRCAPKTWATLRVLVYNVQCVDIFNLQHRNSKLKSFNGHPIKLNFSISEIPS